MSGDQLTGLGALVVGVTMSVLGGWAYLGSDAEKYFRKWWRTGGIFMGPAQTLFMLPAGIGFTLMGVAFLFGKDTLTIGLLVGGLGFVILGGIVLLVHPKAIQPRWMQRRKD